MQIKRVLIVYKQVDRKTSSHGVMSHLKTIDDLYQLLKKMGIHFIAHGTQQLSEVGNVDLVITVGGDGTVLAASHYVTDQPILGIKSFGEESVGFFCAATQGTMGLYLRELFENRHRPRQLNRLKITINGHPVKELALNDVLLANAFPASMSKYQLSIGRTTEHQLSSGIWIATAAGSTAAIHAAGGKVMPISSKKIQYLVREPYSPGRAFKLHGGVLSEKSTIKIRSGMKDGTLSIDGHHSQYPAPTESAITVEQSRFPLHILWR